MAITTSNSMRVKPASADWSLGEDPWLEDCVLLIQEVKTRNLEECYVENGLNGLEVTDFEGQSSQFDPIWLDPIGKRKGGEREVGWPTGLEPATSRTTIWGSTIELWPPTGEDAKSRLGERQALETIQSTENFQRLPTDFQFDTDRTTSGQGSFLWVFTGSFHSKLVD